MYEELVKRLRNRANGSYEEKCEGCEYTEDFPPCVHCTIKAFNDAADAIEELDNLLNLYRQGKIRRPNNDDKLIPQPVSKTDEFGKAEQLDRRFKWNLDGSCPRCGKHSLQTYGNFCCYCGADMRGEDVPVSDVPLNRRLD